MSPEALRVADVAALLDLSDSQVRRLIKRGCLPAKRFGGCVRVARPYLDGFLASDCETLEEYSRGLDTTVSSGLES